MPLQQPDYELVVDGVPMRFPYSPSDIKVSTHTFHTLFEPYKNSSGTMATLVALHTLGNSVAKETSLLTSSHFL